ncbi:MAG: molybdenum ABC transporter ATP-binding protein [Gammaproteobacteria bacterium]|nr:MAG: molybdenum ABC transporter ATP-binding protein [Gammaproteobacteria bacterium]
MIEVDIRRQLGAFGLRAAFSAPAPALVALFGASGSGKTSVVNAVAGLLRPDAGRIALDGEVLFDAAIGVDVPAERRRLGYVFQDSRLFPHLDVRRNLGYGLRRSQGAARIGFDDVVALLGLESLLARRPGGLSGGERQRVAIGRALLAQPRLLLLDEPLASLDAARREEVLPYLERLRDHWRLPMLYVSHQFDEVLRLATHLVLMEQGSVVAAGSLAEMALHPALGRLAGEGAGGAVLDSVVTAVDAATGLASVTAGTGTLRVPAGGLAAGMPVRLQVLARDVILATQPPQGLSVRNALAGSVTAVDAESPHSRRVTVDVGGVAVLARVTSLAVDELRLGPGKPVWVLVKAVSLRAAAAQACRG